MIYGWEMIRNERQRQELVEDWTPEHDDEHDNDDLITAAIVYAYFGIAPPGTDDLRRKTGLYDMWPWHNHWLKPSTDPVQNLVKAGALLAAEIDRIQRSRTSG